MTNIDESNFAEFMESSLYGEDGFYTLGNGAGRSRDYLTSPEVGDLFGQVVANYIDSWYDSLETDEPAIVVDAGCGPGSMAASIARAHMKNAEMIDYFLVDRSPVHLETCDQKLDPMNTDFSWSLYEQIPECEFPTLVIANELLDNLVFNIGFADEVYKPFAPDEIDRQLLGMDVYAKFGIFKNIDNLRSADVPYDVGHFRIPLHTGIADWFVELAQATSQVSSLTVLFFDYMKSVTQMEDENWLRLYSDNKRIVGVDNVFSALESGIKGDITCDVIVEDLQVILDIEGFSKISKTTQADWLYNNGIDELVGAQTFGSAYEEIEGWLKSGQSKSTSASFVSEREILMDENGLGAFTVVSAKREI